MLRRRQKTFNDKKEKEGDSQQLQYKLVMVAVLLDVDIAVLCPATSQSLLSHPSDFPSTADPTSFHQAGFPVDFPVLPAIPTRAGVATYLPSDVPSDPLAPHQHAAKAAYIARNRLAPSPVQTSCPEPEILMVHRTSPRLAPVLPRPPSTALT